MHLKITFFKFTPYSKNMEQLIYEDETYLLRGIFMQIHRSLGCGFAEIVYKDALVIEFEELDIDFIREKKYEIIYRKKVLPHFYYADFIAMEKIILEIKAKKEIAGEDIAQAMNYLKISGCKLALIVNFGKTSLEVKRIVL